MIKRGNEMIVETPTLLPSIMISWNMGAGGFQYTSTIHHMHISQVHNDTSGKLTREAAGEEGMRTHQHFSH